jgi:hypothetical protein
MRKLLVLALCLLPLSAFAQFGSNTARRVVSGTAAPPALCSSSPVDMYARTGATSPGLYVCLSTNTWTGPLSAAGGSPGSPVNSVQFNSAGSFAGTSGLTTDAVGNFTLAQGTITSSTPFMNHTVTWNAGGVAFTNWLSSITCTAAATASIAAGFGTAGTQWQFKYGGANCASPQMLSPDGSGAAAPAYSFSGNTGTGMYRTASNHLAFSIGGTTQMIDIGTGGANVGPVEVNSPICDWTNGNTCIFLTPNSPAITGAGTPDGQIERGFNVNVTPVTVNANVTTDQNLMAVTIPANNLNVVGRTLRVFVAGVYSTAATSTAQMTLKIKICSVSGCGSGNVASVISIQSAALGTLTITNNAWNGTFYVTTQTASTAGAWESHGAFGIDEGALATAADSFFNDSNNATVTGSPSAIDTTAQNFLQVSFAFSAGSTSNSVTERQLVVEVVN